MNTFVQRLKYYGIGFLIGLLFVVVFFQNRGCSWLPENRVKNTILDRVLVLPEKEREAMKEAGLSEADLIQVLNDGEVNFELSLKEGNPQVYAVEKELKGKNKTVFFTLPKESFIAEIHISERKASKVKNTSSGLGKLISFPRDENIVYPDTTASVTCKQTQLKLINPKDILKLLKKNGAIDFEKSDLKLAPKPIHYISFTDKKGRQIGASAIWYKTKLNITEFYLPFDSPCK